MVPIGRRRLRSEEAGQATVEYAGLLLLAAAMLSATVAIALDPARAARVGQLLADRLICVVGLGSACGAESVERGFAPDVAAALRDHAPEIRFEDGEFVSLPVDPRRCRDRSCADTSIRGELGGSHEGERPVAFVHAIDCRPGSGRQGPAGDPERCAGPAAGHLYLQYWLYYPDSLTRPFGRLGGYHRDDWESLQVRIGPDGDVDSRASSHHGHQYGPDKLSDVDPGATGVGGLRRADWGPYRGYVWVSAGSHAGRAAEGESFYRAVPAAELELIATEAGLEALDGLQYEVTPPWRKRVWTAPEHGGT